MKTKQTYIFTRRGDGRGKYSRIFCGDTLLKKVNILQTKICHSSCPLLDYNNIGVILIFHTLFQSWPHNCFVKLFFIPDIFPQVWKLVIFFGGYSGLACLHNHDHKLIKQLFFLLMKSLQFVILKTNRWVVKSQQIKDQGWETHFA